MFDFNRGRKFWFGKHKGKYILEVIHKWGYYIEWCQVNIKGFKLTEEEKQYLKQRSNEYLNYWNNWGKYHYPRGENNGGEILWIAIDEWLENPKYESNKQNKAISFEDIIGSCVKMTEHFIRDYEDDFEDYPSFF